MQDKSKKSKPNLIYARFEGEEVITRPITRGRKPLGYVKCEVREDGSLTPVDSNEKVPSGAKMNEPQNTKLIDSDSCCTVSEIRSCIKPMRVEQGEDMIKLFGCDIIGDCPVEYLEKHPVQSRIEINTKTGDISLWKLAYKAGHPDIVLKGVVETEVNVG